MCRNPNRLHKRPIGYKKGHDPTEEGTIRLELRFQLITRQKLKHEKRGEKAVKIKIGICAELRDEASL